MDCHGLCSGFEFIFPAKNDGHLSKQDRGPALGGREGGRGPEGGGVEEEGGTCNLNPAKTDRPVVASGAI